MAERTKTATLSLRISPEVETALDAWIKAQRVPPTKTAVVELAIREFLQRAAGAEKIERRSRKSILTTGD